MRLTTPVFLNFAAAHNLCLKFQFNLLLSRTKPNGRNVVGIGLKQEDEEGFG